MRKIAVFTGTRAEYGLLYWLMKAIQNDPELTLQLIVSGAHLSPQYGETWKEIAADGFKIDAKIEMILAADTPSGVLKSMAVGMIGFADALPRLSPDMLIILGDRTEALAIAQSALIFNIPMLHLHGGEITLGAYDNSIRHAISKMAMLHGVALDSYRRRIIQMGEESAHVFNVGALGIEHIIKTEKYTFDALAEHINLPLKKPYFLVTYHAVTLDPKGSLAGCEALLQALDDYKDRQVLFTYPNADNGGFEIIQLLEKYCSNSKRAFIVKSLGQKSYLSAIQYAEVVLGNSSSGIIEVPSFGVPTVNIGIRQEGRLAPESVLHCENNYDSIKIALTKALSKEFKTFCQSVNNPYGDGHASERIIKMIKAYKGSTLKCFQDMDINYAIT